MEKSQKGLLSEFWLGVLKIEIYARYCFDFESSGDNINIAMVKCCSGTPSGTVIKKIQESLNAYST